MTFITVRLAEGQSESAADYKGQSHADHKGLTTSEWFSQQIPRG